MAGMKMPRGRGAVPPMGKLNVGVLKRLMGILFKDYKPLLITIGICLVISAITGSLAGLFLNTVYDLLSQAISQTISVSTAWSQIISTVIVLASIYLIGIIASFIYQQLGAILTQKFLRDMRNKMFTKMQKLPVKYFDTNTHGDIMSVYTNDIDALRQLISQSLPQFMSTLITIISLSIVMLYLSVMLFLVVVLGLLVITFVVKTIGKNSAKYFMAQQKAMGKVEGYVEEIMHGQKVVKVFNHEQKAVEEFNALNSHLCDVSNKANAFSNMLMPIIHNIGNVLYVLVAFIGGGIYIFSGGTGINISFQSLFANGSFISALQISVVVSFLGMARQFANITGHISSQMNSVIMAMAGADRIFKLLDQPEEQDEGYVTLVRIKEDDNGNVVETNERTGKWAWRHPHKADNTVTYTRLAGDIKMFDVDFGYVENQIVLHDVSLYAEPGQKIAFVGATGAGKTTITNLINRFYDIADGKIRYDGININKIKKSDLRRSLGIVLQDTCLFTGTVMENIRYGRLDATDEECIDASKLANAHDFITRLPNGYDTMLTADGGNLSQGQRQLIAIARAAVADAPVMILDEATSSIDTRTERKIGDAFDKLMEGRTSFVVAHRLSTIIHSDCILVMEGGRIAAMGTHAELLASCDIYREIYRSQNMAGKEDAE